MFTFKFKRAHLRWAWTLAAVAVALLTQQLFGFDPAAALPGSELFGPGGAGLLFWSLGHCDTLDGPLVTLARRALDQGDVRPVLAWVRPDDEAEVRRAFDHAQSVRKLGAEARELADTHFLETLVRVHRAGEGAPYTGLKPAGLDLGPAVPAADKSLDSGSPEEVLHLLTDAIRQGVHRRFLAARHARHFDVRDVAAGRDYVAAYVDYVHYVEKLWDAARGAGHAHGEHAAAAHAHVHH
ncbi:hypothetical protein FBR04_16620 [Betaproteobacteria bacterium PRO7]|jgi:hypothetical protein|nr:hypothetical protein [Betaproteobacteria bacterium PRO7]